MEVADSEEQLFFDCFRPQSFSSNASTGIPTPSAALGTEGGDAHPEDERLGKFPRTGDVKGGAGRGHGSGKGGRSQLPESKRNAGNTDQGGWNKWNGHGWSYRRQDRSENEQADMRHLLLQIQKLILRHEDSLNILKMSSHTCYFRDYTSTAQWQDPCIRHRAGGGSRKRRIPAR